MKNRINILLLALSLCIALLAPFSAGIADVSAASEETGLIEGVFVTEADDWVKVDDDTWTYTFEGDGSLHWSAYESGVPDGYVTVNTEEHPVDVIDGNAVITNSGKEYTVSFDPNTGRFESSPIAITKTVKLFSKNNNVPGTPNKTGYEFLGWYNGDTLVFDAEGKAVDGEYWAGNGADATWKYENNLSVMAKWQPASIGITYDLQGGTFGENHPGSTSYGTAVTIDAPTRTGYSFLGWTVTGMDNGTHYYGTSASYNTSTTETTLTAEQTLGKTWYKDLRESRGTVRFTANWVPKSYTIAYLQIEGATIQGDKPSSVRVDDAFTLNNPTKPGWTFDGWDITGMDTSTHTYGSETSDATSLEGVTATSFKNLRMEEGTVTFTAKWTENVGKIIYDVNGHGTSPGNKTIKYATQETAPYMSHITGYDLIEWNTKPDGTGQGYRPGAIIKAANTEPFNLTLYAIWQEMTATLTYNYNDDVTPSATSTMRYTAAEVIPDVVPTREGFTFKEWNTGRLGAGTGYQPGDVFKAANVEPIDSTLYAIWEERTATITYHNNGHGTAPDPVTISYSRQANAAGGISEYGWVFNGWNTRADGSGTLYAPGAMIKAANVDPSDLDLYAMWTKETYIMTVIGNEGTPEAQNFTVALNASDNTEIELPRRGGYTCTGLYTRRNGGSKVYDETGKITNDGTFFNNGVLVYRGNFTLYAQWEESKIDCIVYDKNCDDEVSNMPDRESKFIGKPITLKNNIPERDGYTFICWSTTPDGMGDCFYTQNGAGSAFPLTSDEVYGNYVDGPITLYAIWQQSKIEESPQAKLPITYNFYTSDVENKLLDTEIVYRYTNFFLQNKEIKARRTIFVDSDQELVPEVVISSPMWHSGDPIPVLADLPDPILPNTPDPEDPSQEETPVTVTTVSNEEELRSAIDDHNFAEDGAQNIRLGDTITLTEPLTVPIEADVTIDLDGKTLDIGEHGHEVTQTITETDPAPMPEKISMYVDWYRGTQEYFYIDMENSSGSLRFDSYDSVYLCNAAGERLSGNLNNNAYTAHQYLTDDIISVIESEINANVWQARMEINGHLSQPFAVNVASHYENETQYFNDASEAEFTFSKSPAPGTRFCYYIKYGGSMSSWAQSAYMCSGYANTYNTDIDGHAETIQYDGDKSFHVSVEDAAIDLIYIEYYSDPSALWTGDPDENFLTDISFDEWSYERTITTIEGDDSVALRVFGDLYLSNGTVAAGKKCASVYGMGQLVADETVKFKDATYAIYFEEGNGSAIVELNGSEVLNPVLCGTENEHSLLTVDKDAKISSEGLHADFTSRNAKGLVMKKSFTVVDPTAYVDPVENTVLEYGIDGFNFRVYDNTDLASYTVVAESNSDAGYVSGDGEYPEGQYVTLEAVAMEHAEFIEWTDENGNSLSNNPTWTFRCRGNVHAIAVFRWIPHTITVISDNDTMGTVSGSGEYGESQTATITAVAKIGYKFAGWLKDSGTEYVSTDPSITVEVEDDATYKAVFAPVGKTLHIDLPTYLDSGNGASEEDTVTVTVNEEPLPLDGTVNLNYGDLVSIYAEVDEDREGYSIKGYYNGEEYVAEGPFAEFTMTEDTDLTVVLEVDDSEVTRLIDNFVINKKEHVDSEFASYQEEFLNNAQPVGSYYTSTSEALGKGEHYDDEYVDGEANEDYQVDLGLMQVEEKFGGTWERVENTFLFADGDKSLGSTGGRWKYNLSLGMNVGEDSIAFMTESRNAYQNLGFDGMMKLKYGLGGTRPGNTVIVTEKDSASRSTTIIPPYQSVYVFRRVS